MSGLLAMGDRRAVRLWLPVAFTAVALVYLGYAHTVAHGTPGNVGAFIGAGDVYSTVERLPAGTPIQAGTGYDGQFFFALGQDPFLLEQDTVESLDAPVYRYQRILLPLLGWLVSGGDPSVLQWALPLINLSAVLGSGFMLARFLQTRGLSPWWTVAYMLSFGVFFPILNDLGDPLATGLFVAGVIWWLEDRRSPALLALAACLFAREVFILPVAVVCLAELVRSRGRAWLWAVPILLPIVWSLSLTWAFGQSPSGGQGVNSPQILPLAGAIGKIATILQEDVPGAANWELLFVLLSLAFFVHLVWRSVTVGRWALARKHLPSREGLIPVVGLASVALVPFLTARLWGYPPSYTRYIAPAAALVVLSYAVTGDRRSRALAIALLVLSLTNPFVGLLPVENPPSVTAR